MKTMIKKDMYIRTKNGIIDKVVFDYNGHCIDPNCECKHVSCDNDYHDEKDIVRASYDIIDILEIGDYVNGSPVCLIKTDEKDRTWVYTDNNYKCGYLKNDIESIVTKEQMEEITYRMEGK